MGNFCQNTRPFEGMADGIQSPCRLMGVHKLTEDNCLYLKIILSFSGRESSSCQYRCYLSVHTTKF